MKNSKETATIGSANVRKNSQRVPIAAQVFGNYVFVPAARHPDEGQSRSRLQGAALLVFADQRPKQIELGARNAPHVSCNATLRPAEDTRNKIVSFHEENSVTIEGPRFSLWGVCAVAIGLFWAACYALDIIAK